MGIGDVIGLAVGIGPVVGIGLFGGTGLVVSLTYISLLEDSSVVLVSPVSGSTKVVDVGSVVVQLMQLYL